MKKHYEELELRVIRFASEDVITASGEEECLRLICTGIECFRLDSCIEKAICINLGGGDCPRLEVPCFK
ncbi:MAG: hypothetical protein IJJ92_01590 [Clostridia bacterium]|nr:hypothetical protein [Clostridia bacterium]